MSRTTPSIVLIGSTGRVGRAVRSWLGERVEVRTVGRFSTDTSEAFATELAAAADGVDAVVNVAGVAHLDANPDARMLSQLVEANIDLPLATAGVCLRSGVSFIHVSSVKAVLSSGQGNAYAMSKHLADASLQHRFGTSFEEAGLRLAIVRPPALLAPPFDAGRLRRLRPLSRLPRAVVPEVAMPALTIEAFAQSLLDLVTGAGVGLSVRDYPRSERATLAQIRDTMVRE